MRISQCLEAVIRSRWLEITSGSLLASERAEEVRFFRNSARAFCHSRLKRGDRNSPHHPTLRPPQLRGNMPRKANPHPFRDSPPPLYSKGRNQRSFPTFTKENSHEQPEDPRGFGPSHPPSGQPGQKSHQRLAAHLSLRGILLSTPSGIQQEIPTQMQFTLRWTDGKKGEPV